MPYKVSNLNGTFQQQYEADPRIVAALAARQEADKVPIYSPGQGVARALSKMLDAYTQKQIQGEYQQKQTDQNNALADALAPPTDNPGLQAPPVQLPTTSTPVDNGALGQSTIQSGGSQIDASVPDYQTENPNRSKISALLNSGLISGGSPSVATALMKSAGLGEPKDPTKLGPGDVLLGPDNKTPLYSAPFKPDAAPKPETDPEIVRTAKYLFPDDMKAQSDYIQKNSRASTVNIDSGNQDAGWQMAMDPANNNTPYRVNVRTGEARGLDGKPYVPQGYGKVSTNNPRTAVAIYMDKWKQEHPNASADDVLTQMNMFTGQQAEHRTLGTQGAKVESANAGLDTVIDQSNTAYAKLPRGQFVPFNKLAEMAMSGAFSSPEQADAYAADAGVINLWGKSINPNGVLTVEAQKRGEQLLSQAQSPEAHAAVLQRMRAEGMASTGGIDHFRNPKSATAKPQPAAGAKPPTVSNW